MTRISLKEAYDNKDVVTQIFGLRDEVDRHSELLDNLPNPDLTNCVLKTGDQTIAGEKTFTDPIRAEGGLEVDTEGGFEINGSLIVNGDIIQNGEAYETHAEQVFSKDDLIVTRDGAVSALPSGTVSGIQIQKYDGVNNSRLAVDNSGIARVGDVGDEQPLMVRAESADMVGGSFLKWDGQRQRAVSGTLDDTPTAGSSNAVKSSGIKSAVDTVQANIDTLETAVTGKVSGVGTVGDDKHPVKVVNGEAVAVSAPLMDMVPAIMAYNTAGGTIEPNTVGLVELNIARNNDSDTFTLSNNRITIKKRGYYLVKYELLAVFSGAGRAQVGFSYNNDNEYSYSITYVQGVSGSETITGSYLINVTTENSTIGLTAWCANGSISVSNAKQGTKLILVKLS